MKLFIIVFLGLLSFANGSNFTCASSSYPPPKSDALPIFLLDLDLPPEQRWTEIINSKYTELRVLILDVQTLMSDLLGTKIYDFLFNNAHKIEATLPSPYQEEIRSIAKLADVPTEYITMYNIFYEFFVLCTSIIVEDPNGVIYHGRNLDNGAFLGWDAKNHIWKVTEALKPLAITLEWKKNGSTLFKSVNFVGYIGVLTAVKQDKFSFSIDKRFALNNGIVGILEWLLFHDHDQHWVSFLAREVLENGNSFNEAKELLSKNRLLAPVYYILAGTQPGEGVVITRYRENADFLSLGSSKSGEGSWFLVQTNYDHWKAPPFFDNRRTPAMHCLEEFGHKNASFQQLYDVFSTRPVLNKGTVYTSLMHAKSGTLEAFIRSCPSPCPPW